MLSFAAGIALPWPTVLPAPIASIIYGAVLVANERPNYDMHGFGYIWGAFGAILAAIVWLLGRWVRRLPPKPG